MPLSTNYTDTNPCPVKTISSALPAGASTEATQLEVKQQLVDANATLSDISAQLPPALGPQPVEQSLSTIVETQVSTLNSTSQTLGINQSWTGTGEDVSHFGVISVAVYSNVASATLGLEFQASPDNVNWYVSDNYTILAGVLKNYSLAPPLKYFRLKYTNDGSAQNTFFIETCYRQTYVKSSSHRIGDTVVADDDAELVVAQIVGKTTGGGGGSSYVAVKASPSGALTVDATVSSSVLPTGASTSALQTTGNNSLASIDTKLSTINGILDSVSFDAFSVAYPNPTTEVYSYFSGGLSGTLKMTLTVIYTDISKEYISSAVRS